MENFTDSMMDFQIANVKKKEIEFNDLLNKKCVKVANKILEKRYTQLSYLPKKAAECELSFAKEALLDRFIRELNMF